MTILVTGSSGHLGEALVRTLRKQKHEVLGLDILPSDTTDRVGSIASREFVKECMQGIHMVLHTATLHKPHVATHTKQDFIDTNITGTLNLLEEAIQAKVRSFVFTSTTSTFGDSLTPPEGQPAIWITEDVPCIPKNIYGATKVAAEDLCQLFYRNHQLPCLILRTSRFFPEEDDKRTVRDVYTSDNCKANEFLHRRVDVEDVVSAHLLAMEKAPQIGFGRYIISATTPFTREDLRALRTDAPGVLKRLFPEYEAEYQSRGWKMFAQIGRVYVNQLAREELGWQPRYDFRTVLERLKQGQHVLSDLARSIGKKGYHQEVFEEGPYPTT